MSEDGQVMSIGGIPVGAARTWSRSEVQETLGTGGVRGPTIRAVGAGRQLGEAETSRLVGRKDGGGVVPDRSV